MRLVPLSVLALLIGLSLASVATAQDLAVVQQTADTAVLIDRQTVRRTGNTALVRTYAYARPAAGAPQVYVEVEEEFDCTDLRARRRMLRILDPQGRAVSQESGVFSAWQPLTAVNIQVMVAVCQGQGMAAFPSAGTLAAFSQRMGPGQARSSAQAQAPAQAAPVQAPAPLSVWIDNGARAAGANPTLVQAGTRPFNGSVAAVTRLTLLIEPVMIDGQPMRWRETATEFDCVAHRARTADRAYYDLGRTRRAPPQDAAFSQWFDATPGSVLRAQEDLACRGVRGPNARDVTDLDAYQRQFFAGRALPTAAAPLAPPRSQQSSPASLAPGAWVEVEGAGLDTLVQLFDLATRRRAGQVVSLRSMTFLLEPMDTADGSRVHWFESTAEYDCAGHRWRERIEALLNRDRTYRLATPDPEWDPWRDSAGSNLTRVEDLVCRDVRGSHVVARPDLSLMRQGASQLYAHSKAVADLRAGRPQAPPQANRYWVWGTRDASSIAVIDLPSRSRLGSFMAVDELILMRQGVDVQGRPHHWQEVVLEVDCNTARYRERRTSLMLLDRSRRVPLGDDVEREWINPAANSAMHGVAAFLCRDVRGAGIDAVPDLAAFQQRFMAGQPVIAPPPRR